MKTKILLIACLFVGNLFATPGILEAIKNPSTVTVIVLNGEKNESVLLTKNAKLFTSLQGIIIRGISDSIVVEQDIVAVAACSNVSKLTIENCGISHLSGALLMLGSVHEMEISNCKNLEISSTFSMLSRMSALKSISFTTNKLASIPQSFGTMRGFEKINIRNNDISLADGYALNNSSRESLFVKESLQLGFGNSMLVLEYSCYDKKFAKEHISIIRDMLQGVACLNGEMVLPQKSPGFTRENPLVKPPVEGLDVQKNIYSADATTGGAIEYPSGTKIFIPDHAFVDANGKEVEGNVTIDYREFRDQVDILISGIPMTYDSAGQKGNFESAGMFEINASVEGKEVFLAPGKKVDLEFVVVDTASNYNFYRLDEKQGWIYQENLGATDNLKSEMESEDNDYFPAFAFHRRTMTNLSKMPRMVDTTAFETRYADLTYSYSHKNKNYVMMAARQFYSSSSWRLNKIVSKKGYCCFKIQRRFRNGTNPEMSAFSNVTWKTTDNVREKELRRLFRKRSGVNDVRIYYDGGSFQLEFKTFKGFKTISATPVRIVNGKMVDDTPKFINARYKLYSRILDQRKRALNREIKNNRNQISRFKRKLSADSVRYWKRLRPIMSERQKKMSYPEWVQFARKQKFNNSGMNPAYSLTAAGQQFNRKRYQRLSAFQFGIFNCDHTLPLPQPVEVFAVCNVGDGQKKNMATIYLIDQTRNMTIAYQSTDETSPVPIAFGRTNNYALVAVGWDGNVFTTDATSFRTRNQIDAKTCSFVSKPVSDQPLTAQELRSLILKSK